MRQRKAKDLEKRLAECSEYMIDDPGKGSRDYFGSKVCGTDDAANGLSDTGAERELFLEIGCGKGQFIIKKALENPDADFIAVEGQETVILRALEKVSKQSTGKPKPENLKFMLTFIDNMEDFFDEDQLSGIYLNFSDPWPKARHAKRRLTYRKRLENYGKALKPGGFIEIKTDNDDLFDFTLREIEDVGYETVELTRDLHSSSYASRLTTTEYEDKFSGRGKNINYVKIIVG